MNLSRTHRRSLRAQLSAQFRVDRVRISSHLFSRLRWCLLTTSSLTLSPRCVSAELDVVSCSAHQIQQLYASRTPPPRAVVASLGSGSLVNGTLDARRHSIWSL